MVGKEYVIGEQQAIFEFAQSGRRFVEKAKTRAYNGSYNDLLALTQEKKKYYVGGFLAQIRQIRHNLMIFSKLTGKYIVTESFSKLTHQLYKINSK